MSDIHEQIYKQWMANSYRQTLTNGIWECIRGPSKLGGEPKEILHLFCFCCDYVGSGRAQAWLFCLLSNARRRTLRRAWLWLLECMNTIARSRNWAGRVGGRGE